VVLITRLSNILQKSPVQLRRHCNSKPTPALNFGLAPDRMPRYAAITPNTTFLNRLLECLKNIVYRCNTQQFGFKAERRDGDINEDTLWLAARLPLCSPMWLSLQLQTQRKEGPCRREVNLLMPYLLPRCCTHLRHSHLQHTAFTPHALL
jgi:hypothetical protein